MLEYTEENDSVLFKADPNPCPNDCLNKSVSDASSVLKQTQDRYRLRLHVLNMAICFTILEIQF